MSIDKYTAKAIKIPGEPPYWDTLRVEIYQGDEQIGSYDRSYPSLFDTFMPFEQEGREYALYSRDYTATRIMRLPSCEDLCGEESSSSGFCPTGYHVPRQHDEGLLEGRFGFVSGCVWGDDTSWKIQFLDLSRIEESVLIRDDRFGYIELPENIRLQDAIRVQSNGMIQITHAQFFWMRGGVVE